MKKLLVLTLAVAMVVAFTLPASAFESVFGGYWRARFITEQSFNGTDDRATADPADLQRVDTRTRLYYTAVLNDNLKLVNKFEMDNQWGTTAQGGYGDFGADGIGIEVKQTYMDANIGPVRAKVGTFDITWARGFIYADEQSGVTLSFKMGDVLVPISWIKGNEGGGGHNSLDADILGLYPVFQLGEKITLNPFIIYAYSKSGGAPMAGTTGISTYSNNVIPGAAIDPAVYQEDGAGLYWIGTDFDATLGSVGLWASAAYVGGTIKNDAPGQDDIDAKGWFVAGGASMPLGPVELHGQAFYASGDDDPDDSDFDAFFGIGGGGVGEAYYWSEIMGNGVFDEQISAGSTVDISNLWAANIGVSLKPVEKLKLTADIWYAAHVEDDYITDEKNLGTEVDLRADYQLTEGLNLTVIGAYLFADDATSLDGDNQEDPYEVGAQLSLSF
jgi:hypothetical protein